MLRKWAICAALAAGLFTAASSNAATITKTYKFTLGGFIDAVDSPLLPLDAPFDTVKGGFTVTFDPDAFTQDGPVSVNAYSGATVDSPFTFTFWPAGGGYPAYLSIGGSDDGSEYINYGNDFTVSLLFTDPGAPQLATCDDGYSCGSAPGTTLASGYITADAPDHFWLATSGSVTAVPEAGTWALMLAGFGLTGALLRRRARLSQAI